MGTNKLYNIHLTMVNLWLSSPDNYLQKHGCFNLASLIKFKKIIMKKIFLAASLLCLITAGVNAHPGPGKTPKKGTAPKSAVISTTAPGDTTHHKKTAMGSKKHHKMATTTKAKAK